MQAAADPRTQMPRPSSRTDAERLVEGVLATLAALETVLADETALVRAGKIAEGLAQEEHKAVLAARYLRELETVKGNAVALARFAPAAVERLKTAHSGFGRTLEANRMVLATARAVSEGLIKTVSDELDRASRPATYAPSAAAPRQQRSAPLILSKSL